MSARRLFGGEFSEDVFVADAITRARIQTKSIAEFLDKEPPPCDSAYVVCPYCYMNVLMQTVDRLQHLAIDLSNAFELADVPVANGRR